MEFGSAGSPSPIPVSNIDGFPNKASSIWDVANMVLHHKGHSKQVQFAVTRLSKQKLILRYSWLWKHNPEINWETKEVKMSCCSSGCTMCRDETQAKS